MTSGNEITENENQMSNAEHKTSSNCNQETKEDVFGKSPCSTFAGDAGFGKAGDAKVEETVHRVVQQVKHLGAVSLNDHWSGFSIFKIKF